VSGVPLPEIAVPPPKVVVSFHHLAMPFRHHNKVFVICDKLEFQLIFRKTITIVATRRQILRLKCTKFYFGAGGAYSAPADPLAGLSGLLLRGGRGRKGRERERGEEGKGKGREKEGRKCRVPPHTFE